MRMNRNARPSTDVAQGRFKTRIAEGLALTLPRSDPNGVNIRRRAALGPQVLFVNRPEVVGDGHAVLIARTLQLHCDKAPLAINILQFHAQNPMPASNRTPIADALTCARQQYQNRFIAIGTGAVDQLLNRRGLQDFRQRSRNATTESITLSLTSRQVATDHPMTQIFGERVAGGWVDPTLPRTSPVFGIAANAVLKIGCEHAQPMVDRARLARLLRTPCANSTLLRAPRELGDVAADSLPRDMVGIASRGVQPTEKMREAQRVSPLRVDGTVAQAQLR